MKTFLAVLMGLCSGLLIYFVFGMSTASSHSATPFIAFAIGWGVSSWGLLRNARSSNQVLQRGFLLGAAEWLCMIVFGIIFSGHIAAQAAASSNGSDASAAGAIIGGGVSAFLIGGFSMFMAMACMMAFAIAYFAGRPRTAHT